MPTCQECDQECGCDEMDSMTEPPDGWVQDVESERDCVIWRHIEPLVGHLRALGTRLATLDDFLRACDDGSLGIYVKPCARMIGQ